MAGVTDEKDAECCWQEGKNVPRPQIGQFETRETGWNVADHRHSFVGQTDDGQHSDGNDHCEEHLYPTVHAAVQAAPAEAQP